MVCCGGETRDATQKEECTQSGSKRRKCFTMPARVPLGKPCLPRICDLVVGQRVSPVPPPPEVKQKLGHSKLIVGVDIETHDWEQRTGNKASTGTFGFYSLCHPDDFQARVVQIGWAVGMYGQKPQVKERILKPEGFSIAAKAAKYHGICQERAMAEGRSLQEVLDEFMRDVVDVQQRGGRLVVHHLEFDCGIILRELQRVGSKYQQEWRDIAKRGLCTMDPNIGRWVRQCLNEDYGSETSKNTMKLSELVSKLMPSETFGPQHTAGADAHRHWRLYFEFLMLAGLDKELR